MLTLLTATALAAGAPAAPMNAPPPISCVRSFLAIVQACEGDDFAKFRAAIAANFNYYDLAKDGLEKNDAETASQRQRAIERAESVKAALVYDLDGDLEIEKSEAMRASLTPRAQHAARDLGDLQFQELLLEYDSNRDGRIEQTEILTAPLPHKKFQLLATLQSVFASDANGNDRIEEGEFTTFAEGLFREADMNGDGLISREEQIAQTDRRKISETWLPDNSSRRLCALPQVPRNAQLLLYSGNSGAPAEAGPDARQLTEVRIEPGTQPLYLILISNFQRLWRFSGATERITNVVLGVNRRETLAQASGLPEERLIRTPVDCLRWADSEKRLEPVKKAVFLATSREPDRAIATPRADMISWPSGEIMPKPVDRRNWKPVDLCTDAAQPLLPSSFGSSGVQAHYNFVTQGSTDSELESFLRVLSDVGFSFVPMTVNLNGYDTLFVPGRAALTDAEQVRQEFRAACALRTGRHIFLSNVRYNLTTQQSQESFRVR